MKKFPLFLSLNLMLVSLASLGACSNNEKVDLMYGNKNASGLTTISFDSLKEKVDSEQTFLLAVQYSDGCACWNSEAKPVLEKYVLEKHIDIYHIKLSELDGGGNRFGITIITGNVSFAIFENGSVKHCITTKDDVALKKYDEFVSYFESVVNLPRIYYVNLDDVDNMYRSEETNIIYFGRSTCGDCGYLETHFLKDWSKAHPNYKKNIYYLDCDVQDIRLDDEGNVNQEQWQTFKNDYGLSNKYNVDYGYDNGYVPTFLLIKGSLTGVSYLSGSVAFNDTVTKSENGYEVTNSYYTNERLAKLEYIDDKVETKVLKGLKLNSEDVYDEKYVFWKHESAEKYHNVLTEKFLDFAENK